MKLIAFTIKGLENIAEKEILREITSAKIIRNESKAVIFECEESGLKAASELTTVDDICVYAGEIEEAHKLNHKILAEKILELDYETLFNDIAKFREVDKKKFSLTVSLPSFENLKTIHFKNLLSKSISNELGLTYMPFEHSNFDIRIFRGAKTIIVGVRLTTESLHHRVYKEFSRRGSLRPTVAAALVEYTTDGRKGKLVDSFCGSGTILCEAFLKGNEIYGGDIDKNSIEITKSNLKNLKFKDLENVKVQDATQTDFENEFFDYAISNLPWGKQIDVNRISVLILKSLTEYKRIVKKGGVICILTDHSDVALPIIEDLFPNGKVEKFTISMVGQQPVVVKIKL